MVHYLIQMLFQHFLLILLIQITSGRIRRGYLLSDTLVSRARLSDGLRKLVVTVGLMLGRWQGARLQTLLTK